MRGFILIFLIVFGLFLGILSLLYQSSSEKPADFAYQAGGEPRTLDPAYITGLNEGRMAGALFEGLVNLDPKTNKPIPSVASTWQVSADGKTYRFTLRRDSWWVSQGNPVRPLTVEDFIYSWFRILDHKIPCDYAFQFFYIVGAEHYYTGMRMHQLQQKEVAEGLTDKEITELAGYRNARVAFPNRNKVGIKKIDAWTLEITLIAPTPYFLELLAFWTYFPVPQEAVEAHGIAWTRKANLVTNGAFYIADHKLNYKLRFLKNPHYWNGSAVKLNTLDAFLITSHQTAFNLFLTGELHWINECPPLFLDSVKTYLEEGKWSDAYITTKLSTFFIRYNCTQPPFDDVRVRLAFSLCIDRANWVEQITGFYEQPAHGYVPALPGYPKNIWIQCNIEQAKSLLAAAGYPNGEGFPSVFFLYNSNETYDHYAAVLQHIWSTHLNVQVELQNKPWKSYIQSRRNVEYDLCFSNWIGDYSDPMTFLDMYTSDSGNNHTGWHDHTYDILIHWAKDLTPLITQWESFKSQLSEIVDSVAHLTEGASIGSKIESDWEAFVIHIEALRHQELSAAARLENYSQARMLLMNLIEGYLLWVGHPVGPLFHDVNKNFVTEGVTGFYPNVQNMHPFWAIGWDAEVVQSAEVQR